MGNNLKIAVLSGKGGTGKTLISVNLAVAAKNAAYIDCDTEEPNGHLFFKPENIKSEPVVIPVPYIDQPLCTACRKCVAFCKFNALACIKDRIMVFDEICHSCGGCTLLCPAKAISEKDKIIGKIRSGISENVSVFSGFLNTGEASGIPVIKKLLKKAEKLSGIIFIDCPPGSACAAMESIRDADYCILAAEPTRFGVHNLNMVYELVKLFKKPFGAILNKCTEDENPTEVYCKEQHIPILGKIPFDHELGRLNSNAEIAVRKSEKYQKLFSALLDKVIKEAQNETAVDPQR